MTPLIAALWLAAAPAEDIARAHQLLEGLACDEALPLGRGIATSPFADEAEQREGLMIAGYCLAAIGRVGEAEELFRAAVLEDVRLQAGFPMERRVQYLLDAARADVLAERARIAAERRAALAAQVTLTVLPPLAIVGGQRASFVVRVEGAEAARVESVKLEFRRPDDPEYYSLPVRRGDDGIWRGEIGGIYTGSTRAYELKWFVSASDQAGSLRSFGSREAPRSLPVAAGSTVAEDLRARERLPPITRLLFAGIGAPTATALAAIATIMLATTVHRIDLFDGRDGNENLGMLLLAMTPISMVATEYVTSVWLLDGPAAWLPAIAVGSVAGLADLALLFAWLGGANLDEFAPLTDREADERFAVAAGGASVALVLGVGTAAVVPLALVAWDVTQAHE